MTQRRKLPIVLKLLIALLVIITFLPSLAGRLVLQDQLQKMGATRTDLRVFHLNLWTGRITLKGLYVDADGLPMLAIGELIADIDYPELTSRRLHLDELTLRNAQLPLQEDAGAWRLGPLALPAPTSEPAEADSAATPTDWRWGVSNIGLTNIDLDLAYRQSRHHLRLDRLNLPKLHQWQPEQLSQFLLKGEFNGSPFLIDGNSRPLAAQPSASTAIHIQDLDLGPLLALMQRNERLVLSLDLALEFNQKGPAIFEIATDGALKLVDLNTQQPELRGGAKQLDWLGQSQLQLDDGGLRNGHLQGRLQVDQLALDLGSSDDPSANTQLAGDLQLEIDTTLKKVDSGLSLTQTSDLSLSALQFSQPGLSLSSDSIRWQGRSAQQITDEGLTQLHSDGQLTLIHLALQQPDLTLQQQQLALTGALDTNLKQQLTFAGDLQLDALQLAAQQLTIATRQQHWKGKLALDLTNQKLDTLGGDYRLDGLSVASQKGSARLALEQLLLSQFELDATNQLAAQEFALERLALAEDSPLLDLERLTINNLATGPTRTRLDRVDLGGLNATLKLDPSRQPQDWLDWVAGISGQPTASEPATTAAASGASASEPAAVAYPVQLGKLHLSSPAKVSFIDQRVKAGRPISLTLNTLDISDVDNQSDALTAFKTNARVNRFGDVDLEGKLSLFADQPSGSWKTRIAQLELPAFSPYMNIHTGYLINNGQLHLVSDGTLDKGALRSDTKVTLNQFDVERGQASAANDFDGQLGMPLELAISILTDKKNNVELDIPVNGSLEDPKFGTQSVVNILLAKIAKEGAMSYLSYVLQPYGALLSLGSMALDAAEGASLQLEPAPFSAGSALLGDPARGYLNKLSELLQQREALKLKLCGHAVAADYQFLSAMAQKVAQLNNKPMALVITEPQLQTWLYNVAEMRGEEVKTYLQQERGIDGKRLFSCLPKGDAESSKAPRVQVGL